MLYLHCGWPKTGTTSLQAALVEHEAELAASGLLYPQVWRGHWGEADHSHHRLVELLKDQRTVAGAVERLEDILRDADGDVLISCENFTLLLDLLESAEPPLRFLERVRESTPVTCVWALRRFDDFKRSLYLQLVSIGYVPSSPAEFMDGDRGLRLFTRMRAVEEVVDKVAYVKYEAGGGHHANLLRAMGIPADLLGALEGELSGSSQLNDSLSHKQAVALLNFEALAARSGATLDKGALWDGLRSGRLRFTEDSRCDLVDGSARRDLHEQALRSAKECGFSPYVRFFAADEVEASAESVCMGPEAFSDEDLDILIAHCRPPASARDHRS